MRSARRRPQLDAIEPTILSFGFARFQCMTLALYKLRSRNDRGKHVPLSPWHRFDSKRLEGRAALRNNVTNSLIRRTKRALIAARKFRFGNSIRSNRIASVIKARIFSNFERESAARRQRKAKIIARFDFRARFDSQFGNRMSNERSAAATRALTAQSRNKTPSMRCKAGETVSFHRARHV